LTDFRELRAEVLYAAKQQGIPPEKIKFDWYTLYHAIDQEPVRARRDCDGNIVLHIAALMYDRPADPVREALDYLACFKAAPKTLYVRRQLLNGKAVTDWAKAQGFPTTLFDLHVTIAFSKEPVDWKKFTPAQDNLEIKGGERSVEALGENGDAAVLSFESADLTKRWNEFIDGGASWDWPSYQPHVTISFKADGVDLASIEPYDGTLVFGPEEFAEVNEDWKDTAVERGGDFDESKHPRGEGGKWTDSGGGDGGREAVESAIGSELGHPNLSTVKAAVERNVWNLSVKNVRETSGSKTTTIEVAPKIPSNWELHKNPTGTVRYYNPQKATVNADGYVSPKGDTDKALPKQGEPGLIYRGMSYEEYQTSLASGSFKSVGDYNIGEQELGLTYFSSDPSQAASYAHAFAPWPYMAVPGKPAVVIAVADPGGHIVAPSRPTELGINKPIPASELRAVYFGEPIIAQPGYVDIIQNRGQPPQEGSRMSPSITVEWREEEAKNATVSGSAIGHGYSKDATLKNGKIYTSNVYDAARALYENRPVVLDQPRTLSTLVEHLGKVGNEMKRQGKEAPDFNLCNVSIQGTNLFCADSKGVPRPEMPQFDEQETLAFRQHLLDTGHKETLSSERSDHLRATQNELSGVRVARIAEQLRAQTWPQEKRLVVSSDNYILDGHHLWAAHIANDAEDGVLGDSKTDIARINIDIVTLLNEAKKFGASYEAENRRLRALREFDESKHPRGQPENAGQFGSGGGGSEAPEAAAPAEAPAGVPVESFDAKEQKSLVTYVDNAKAINRFMRGKDLPKGESKAQIKAQVDAINAALKKSSLAADTTLWRGVYGSTAEKLKEGGKGLIGKTVPLGGFQSTSMSKQVARTYASDKGEALLEIACPKGTLAIDMSAFAKEEFKSEQEILLGQGSLKIESLKTVKGVLHIRGTYSADE
jgi:hypothetical protein